MTPDQYADCTVIGVGNPDRGDDGAGRAVAQWLRGRLPPEVLIVEEDGEAASLLTRLEGIGAAYLIDACRSGAPAGAVRRFDVSGETLPKDAFAVSTHGIGLAEAVELARALGQLPSHCIVYAIEAASIEPGDRLSPRVAAAIAEVGGMVLAEICGVDEAGARTDA